MRNLKYKGGKIQKMKMSFKRFVKIFCKNDKDILNLFEKFDYEKIKMRKTNLYENDFHNEEWKKIRKFNYEISNYGRIRNITTKKIKQQKFQRYGMQVILWDKSYGYTFTVSRLVAIYFIRPLDVNERVFHKDKNIRNNYYLNLKISR